METITNTQSLAEVTAMKSLAMDHTNALVKKALLRLISKSEKKEGCTDMDVFNNDVSEIYAQLTSHFIHEGLCGGTYSSFQYFFTIILTSTNKVNRLITDEATVEALIKELSSDFGDFHTDDFYETFETPMYEVFEKYHSEHTNQEEFIFLIKLITCFTSIQ